MALDPLFLATAIEGALIAGRIQRSFRTSLAIEKKGPIDLVTAADLEAERAFRRRVGEKLFSDVFMDELVTQPIETMARLYDRLDLPLSAPAEDGMRARMRANPQHKHGALHYTLEEFGLGLDEVRAAFHDYTLHFNIRAEV